MRGLGKFFKTFRRRSAWREPVKEALEKIAQRPHELPREGTVVTGRAPGGQSFGAAFEPRISASPFRASSSIHFDISCSLFAAPATSISVPMAANSGS